MTDQPPPRLLYLVSEDWYFLSHRLPMARAARDAGYEVHVATRVANGGAAIAAEGFTLHPLTWRRGSLDPRDLVRAIIEVRRLYRSLAPDLVHQVAFWPAVIGSLAGFRLPARRLSALAGLGFAFTSDALKARLVRLALRPFLKRLLSGPRAFVLVQNDDDRTMMRKAGIEPSHLFLIPGSGVDTGRLRPQPEPDGPMTAGYVGRLLDDKGLRTLVDAQVLLAARGAPIRLLIAGEADLANPASIPADEIARWRKQPGIEVLGHVPVMDVWSQAQIAVLPSRREGLPLSLLEAAACGRPIVATDVPGCRAIAREGVNALLVPRDDAPALAAAIARLAADADMRARFGAASRQMVEREFSSARIGREIVALYDRLLGRRRPAAEVRGQ
jgi:glycosyltransferase involved in cell wall biosynthesis